MIYKTIVRHSMIYSLGTVTGKRAGDGRVGDDVKISLGVTRMARIRN